MFKLIDTFKNTKHIIAVIVILLTYFNLFTMSLMLSFFNLKCTLKLILILVTYFVISL